MIQFWLAQIFSWMDGKNLYQPVNYKLTEPLTAEKHIHYMSPSNTSEKTFPGNLPDVFEKIFFQLSKLSNFDVEVTSCDTWGVVNLGSITFGSYPQKKTQDARIPKSPAVPQPFFRCRETPQPRPSTGFGSHFLLILKWSRHKKHGGPPAVNIPQTAKLKVLGFPQGMGFQVWFISSNLVHLHFRSSSFSGVRNPSPLFMGWVCFFPRKTNMATCSWRNHLIIDRRYIPIHGWNYPLSWRFSGV